MPAIFLSESDVDRLIDIHVAIEALEQAFASWSDDRIDNVPRRRARAPGIVLHSMSAAAAYLDRVGWKQYTTTRHGANFLVGIYAASSGNLEALIEADRLGQLRTGAATGVALRHLAIENADSIALIGCGWQAESQLAAAAAVRPLQHARVFCRSPERRQAFAVKMSRQLDVEVVAVDSSQQAVENMPMVVTATTSRTPVVDGKIVAPGATVCAVGSNAMNRAEVDTALIRRAARVVCDDVSACQTEAGDFADALQAGDFAWSAAVNLADVVAGRSRGRTAHDEILIFKSVGLAIEDVALASRLVDLAHEQGIGQKLPF